jgi:hypothetical protein
MKLLDKGYLILGNINVVNDIIKNYEEQKYIILESSLNCGRDYNTIYLKMEHLNNPEKYFIANGGQEVSDIGTISYKEIFSGLEVSSQFVSKSEASQGKEFAKALSGFVPLFYVNISADRGNTRIECYSQLRYSETDIILIKTGEFDYKREADSVETEIDFNMLLHKLVKKHRENAVFLGNHQCYYRKEKSSKEIEYKFNILSDANIWNIIVDMYNHFKSFKFKDFILEYKDEIQKWDYMNYMFEVLEPEEERGYISFIPQTNGKELIKRKIYTEDQLARTEIHYKDNVVDSPRADFLIKKFGVNAFEFKPFRRVRYDINIESLKSGNVHGIFFDHVTVAGSDKKLLQCEIEYLRTRSLYGNEMYMQELNALKEYVIEYFKQNAIDYVETFYSKLSFMKDVHNRR